MWVDNMVEQKPLLRLAVFLVALLAYFTASVPAMSYEEPEYSIVKKTDVYEVRQYKQRTVAEVTYGEEDSGFRVLFDYISGANKGSKEVEMTIPVTQSKEIDMTVPVTQSTTGNKMSMRFFLPMQYSKQNAPNQMMKELELLTCQRNISLSSHTQVLHLTVTLKSITRN